MKTAKQWILELNLADKREKNWRTCADRIWARYRAEKGTYKKNNFNILWSNTEVIAPAVYNTPPKPDVRRRFKDDDPLGKAVSEVLQRSLSFQVECTPFDKCCTDAVLDMLLPGRGIVRIKYIPTISQIPKEAESASEDTGEGDEEQETGDIDEALEWEQTYPEHVKWDDFRFGPGRSWDEVTWVAFKHRMGRPELERLFGGKGKDLPLDMPKDDDLNSKNVQAEAEALKTAEVWEVWDKDEKEVVFISKSCRDTALDRKSDPLDLDEFFPCPRPMYAINDSTSLIPTPLYEQYREQAEELDRISGRINKIIDALKVRGIYDATLSELSELMRGADNELIPAQSASVMQEGGFDKAIWFLPIQQMAMVIKELYVQREACKQVIYELTGISDIIRGTSNPNETLGAQQLKAQWGGQRLQKMQREVQRFIRDLVVIMGQIVSEKFQPDTIKAMTGLKFPTDAEVQQQMIQMQQQQQMQAQQHQMQTMQAQQTGQPPPPPMPPPPSMPPSPITWEQIFKTMKDDIDRAYRVDIETDSTIAANVQQDMEGIQAVLASLSQFMQAVMPLVQEGVMPMEAAKQIIMQICRRSKMGSAVEDALEKLQQPPQRQDPKMAIEQAKLQGKQQVEQMKLQADQQQAQTEAQAQAQIESVKAQASAQAESMKAQAQAQADGQRMQYEAHIEAQKLDHEARLKTMEQDKDQAFERWKVEQEIAKDITVAEISAKTTMGTALMSAQQTANQLTDESMQKQASDDGLQQVHAQTLEAINALTQQMGKPKTATMSDGTKVSIQ